MQTWQFYFLNLFTFYSAFAAYLGYVKTGKNKNPFGENVIFLPLGAFVWGDVLIFGIFWSLTSALMLFINNWNLFCLVYAIFWSVRSLGEVNYWMHQQFSHKVRNLPENLKFYKFFGNDSLWFVYQTIWQCIAIVSIVVSIYLTRIVFW